MGDGYKYVLSAIVHFSGFRDRVPGVSRLPIFCLFRFNEARGIVLFRFITSRSRYRLNDVSQGVSLFRRVQGDSSVVLVSVDSRGSLRLKGVFLGMYCVQGSRVSSRRVILEREGAAICGCGAITVLGDNGIRSSLLRATG